MKGNLNSAKSMALKNIQTDNQMSTYVNQEGIGVMIERSWVLSLLEAFFFPEINLLFPL